MFHNIFGCGRGFYSGMFHGPLRLTDAEQAVQDAYNAELKALQEKYGPQLKEIVNRLDEAYQQKVRESAEAWRKNAEAANAGKVQTPAQALRLQLDVLHSKYFEDLETPEEKAAMDARQAERDAINEKYAPIMNARQARIDLEKDSIRQAQRELQRELDAVVEAEKVAKRKAVKAAKNKKSGYELTPAVK